MSPDVSRERELQLSDESYESSDRDSVSSVQISEAKYSNDLIETVQKKVNMRAEQKKGTITENSVSILKGRLFRKASEAIKPVPPQKRKQEDTVGSCKVMGASIDTEVDKPGPSSVNQTDIKDVKEFVIRCVMDDASEQESVVTEGNEIIY